MRPVAALMLFTALAAQPPTTWETLEAQGAVISEIRVVVGDVFDLNQPKENHRLGRWANALHHTTRTWAIRHHLVFSVGDTVSLSRIRESERALRAQSFAADVSIIPEQLPDGTARALVNVRDAWTLLVVGNIKRVGGETIWSAALQDDNFLGTGRSLSFWREKGLERSSYTLGFVDPKLVGSHWRLEAQAQRLSDGQSWAVGLTRPFYSLDTPWSARVLAAHTRLRLAEHWNGQEVLARQANLRTAELGVDLALPTHATFVHRLGLATQLDEADYGDLEVRIPGLLAPRPQPDRNLRGIKARWGFTQDRWHVFRDLVFAKRAEDMNLGWDGHVDLGLHHRALGSDRTLPFVDVAVTRGFPVGSQGVARFRGSLTGRLPGGHWEQGRLHTSLVAYHQGLTRQTLACRLAWDATWRPDFGRQLYLGGPEGYRGYGKFELSGDRRWLLSMEDRIHTGWEPWGLARVGLVTFVDVGAIRRQDTGAWSATHGSVGFGLRVAVLKSGIGGAFNLAVAVPTRRTPGEPSYQFLIGSTLGY